MKPLTLILKTHLTKRYKPSKLDIENIYTFLNIKFIKK